jgi:hypothetical protein
MEAYSSISFTPRPSRELASYIYNVCTQQKEIDYINKIQRTTNRSRSKQDVQTIEKAARAKAISQEELASYIVDPNMVSMVAKEEISAMERVKSDEEVLLGAAGEEEDEDVMLPGYRFHPTDEELVTFYLRRKVARKSLRIEVIREMDIYKHDPWDLPSKSLMSMHHAHAC